MGDRLRCGVSIARYFTGRSLLEEKLWQLIWEFCSQYYKYVQDKSVKRFTLATLAVLISAGSILALSPNANAESREQYCRHHRCDRYQRDGDRHYNRDRGNSYSDRDRSHHQRYRYYDRRAHEWRYGYR